VAPRIHTETGRFPFLPHAQPRWGEPGGGHGMGIVVEYAGRTGKPQSTQAAANPLELRAFREAGASPPAVDQTFPMTSPIYKVVDAT
jgi:hypothetical protein